MIFPEKLNEKSSESWGSGCGSVGHFQNQRSEVQIQTLAKFILNICFLLTVLKIRKTLPSRLQLMTFLGLTMAKLNKHAILTTS